MSASSGPWVTVARLVGAFGVRGGLKAAPATANPGRFAPGATVFLAGAPRRVLDARPQGTHLLLWLEGVATREEAAALRGQELQVPAAWLAPLPQGTYYHHQIIGLQAVTTQGTPLGIVEEILETGSNDVYVVRGEGREFLIPAVTDAIRQIDLEARLLVVEPLPGLLD